MSHFTTATLLALPLLAAAHPGPHVRSLTDIEIQEHSRRSLEGCSAHLEKRGHAQRSMERRMALATKIRKERGLPTDVPFIAKRDHPFMKRADTPASLNTSHLSDMEGLGMYANPAELFAGNTTCVLGPDVTEGPYYVLGEYMRYDVTETQEGVDLYLDVELVDVDTCEGIPTVATEIWACNATGVYSGVNATGNGAGSTLDETYLRGTQYTSAEGYVQFKTIVPGHYTGRTPHIHIAGHTNGTWEKNGTYQGLYVSHVGQLFFDQDLLAQVEETAPYNTNTQNLTTNEEDSILLQEADVYDPFVEYVLLGSDLSDGLLAWATLGVNQTAVYAISNAATLTSSGGVANPNSGMGGGGGPPPNGTQSGTAPSASSTAV